MMQLAGKNGARRSRIFSRNPNSHFMKQVIRTGLLAIFLSAGIHLAAQSGAPFISKTVPPIPQVMTQQGAVRVSSIDGLSDGKKAFSLVLENTSSQTVTFTWTVTDKNGKAIGEAHTTTLAAHASVDYSTKQTVANELVILLPEGAKPGDYSVQIKF